MTSPYRTAMTASPRQQTYLVCTIARGAASSPTSRPIEGSSAVAICPITSLAGTSRQSTFCWQLSSLGFAIADNRVGGDADEISDVAVNDCLADDRLIAIWRPGMLVEVMVVAAVP